MSPRATPARSTPSARSSRWLDGACLLSPLVALAALAWSLRGAPLGAPVADDFEFLHRVVFPSGSGAFDSMGASYYWRPLSRQAWFPLVSPLLLAAPGFVAAFHVAILGVTAFLLARLARRIVPWPAAALVAAAIIASEPARALVTWPSGIQHLLAALCLALTAHETFAGRRWSAALAALAAALSHELGALAFVLLGTGGLLRRTGRGAWLDAGLAAVLAGAWAAGYRLALAHGVRLPEGGLAKAAAGWTGALDLGLGAALNAETLRALYAGPLRAVTGVLFAVSLVVLFLPSRRAQLRAVAPLLGATLALAWLGLFPLASLLPDWNAWRAFVPVLALAFAVALACARAHAALGLAVVALRVLALAGAEPAPGVAGNPPPAVSDLSFARIARMQKVVSGSGAIVRAANLPPGSRVAYLGLPELTMNGFRRDLAVQVWTRDTSARFVPYDGADATLDSTDLVLSYDTRPGRQPVFALAPEARRWWRLAGEIGARRPESREYFLRALATQHPESPSLSANVLQNLALQELERGRVEAADSLSRAALAVRGPTADGLALDALIALARGNVPLARRLVGAALGLNPRSEFVLAVLADVQNAASGGALAPRRAP